jgi:hypothetical protein
MAREIIAQISGEDHRCLDPPVDELAVASLATDVDEASALEERMPRPQ